MNAGTLEHTDKQPVISAHAVPWSPTRLSERRIPLRSHLLPDLREVAAGQQLQVGAQGAGVQHPLEALAVVGATKQDVVPEGGVLDPGLLGHVGY